jgi:hypothetical protein
VSAPASLRHLLGRLAVTESRVREAVARRRAEDPDPTDPVRGLYISEEQVDRLLAGPPPSATPDLDASLGTCEAIGQHARAAGEEVRLPALAETFGLDDVDVEMLLIAMAPDLDHRFERLYGYLHDDVTRRRASVGLALDLLGLHPASFAARRRLLPSGRLVARGLVQLGDLERPLLTRTLRVPDRVTAHLLGDDVPAPTVAGAEVEVPVLSIGGAEEVARALAAGIRHVFVREDARTAGMATAVAGVHGAGRRATAIDLGALVADEDAGDVLAAAALEAGLRDHGLVVGPIDHLVERDGRVLAPLEHAAVPVVLVGRRGWDPGWLPDVPPTVTAGPVDHVARQRLWAQLVPVDAGFDPVEATLQFRFRPEQAVRAWQAATRHAVSVGRPVVADDLRLGARLQNAGRLDHLARRVTPRAGMQDLVLPVRVSVLLREIVHRAQQRARVLDVWHMGGRSDKGRGITALFAGESGTGKTLSAEVIARELGLDLYVIDLSTVVDKYIGETEKNLERIFDQAEDVNGVLFFDEADALFGKRSEVSDARDRYANIEIAYLLQRMERFDGITILATNLRANLDEAFTRRIDVLADFPSPEEEDRRRLWAMHLPPELPREADLDLDFLAEAFELAGGDIRNITLAAAYAAAVEGRAVSTEVLVRATAREYRKLGRLVTESEFGPYLDRVGPPLTEELIDAHA